MNTQKSMLHMDCSQLTQFELTTKILTNLHKYNITPAAKLVLLYLSSCYNPKKADVYPKQKTISANIGISERSVVRAIAELCKAGLIVIECKYQNRYRFTNSITKNFQVENMSDNKRKNVINLSDNLAQHEQINHEQIKEPSKEKKENKNDDVYLKQYAQSKGVKNIIPYINAIKKNGGAEKIVSDYKKAENRKNAYKQLTNEFLTSKKEAELNASAPPQSWFELKEKLLKNRL